MEMNFKKQISQKEAIEYCREEDFMTSKLTAQELQYIKDMHRDCKVFLMSEYEIIKRVEAFESEVNTNTCDYYRDVLKFLKDDHFKNRRNLIFGYHKWKLNSNCLLNFMERIMEVYNITPNY